MMNKTKLYFIARLVYNFSMGKFKIYFGIIICFLIFAILPAQAEYKPPQPVGYVNDFAGVMSQGQKTALDNSIKELKTKTHAEIAVVTLKSLDGYPIEDVAITIGRKWGVGEKGKDNGIVILAAPNDRKMRIEVGYGLEGYLTDGQAGRIRDQYMLPYFKQKEYGQGIIYGTQAVIQAVAKGYGVEISGSEALPEPVHKSSKHFDPFIFLILFVIFVTLFGRRRNYEYWGSYDGFGSNYSSGGGDFGGFGGGDFGGGGASGGW